MMLSHSAALTRFIDQLNTSGVAEAIRQVEEHQASIMEALSIADYAAHNAELFTSATRLHELSVQPLADMQIAFDQIHRTWLSEWANIEALLQPTELAKIALSDITHHLAASNGSGPRLDYDALARALNVQRVVMSKVQDSMSDLTMSYRHLTESFGSVADVVTQPSFVLPGATREISTTGFALDVLHPLEDEAGTEADHLEFEGVSENPDLIALLADVTWD